VRPHTSRGGVSSKSSAFPFAPLSTAPLPAIPLDDARFEALQRLARTAENRDRAGDGHPERVGHTAMRLAQSLGLPDADVELIRRAAPLHDIGKLSIADDVLLKPGRLTDEESRQMKRHATNGAAILSGGRSALLRIAREIALTHHEWWDGTGYPSRLKGDAIPLAGRIVAVADVFDALAHERPYKRAWPIDEAVAEIIRLREIQFDPAVVDAFAALDARELVGPIDARLRQTG
jgi:putative two-component system response regulator